MLQQRQMALVAAALILHLILIQPNHPGALTWGALSRFPLELPALLLLLMLLGQSRAAVSLRLVITITLTLLFMLKTADIVSFIAFSRGFNPVTDMSLIEAFIRLIAGNIGLLHTVLAMLAALAANVLIAWLCWWSTGVWARQAPPLTRCALAPAALIAVAVAAAEIGDAMGTWRLPVEPPGTAFTARIGIERAQRMQRSWQELRSFRAQAAEDPFDQTAGLFQTIDRDVLVIFLESYGRTSIDTPFYSDLHRTTLSRYAERLQASGVSMRSGVLTSPTSGGQSWLSHSTFSNGLWITNQVSYSAALASGRQTLFHHAAASGFRTAALMPQITLDWPEADLMGFEDVLVAEDLGYAGLPMNWVTMPDQFTLAALDRLLRNGDDQRHLFAQVVLVSSHAPWVPVPDLLSWEEIGDGTVYNDLVEAADSPAVVWRDRERVREQYRLAVDYTLQSVLEYVALHAEDPPLVLILGDHQAVESIALDDRDEVPFHVIGPEALVEPLKDVAPTLGLVPDTELTALPMEQMRDALLNAYAAPQAQALSN